MPLYEQILGAIKMKIIISVRCDLQHLQITPHSSL